MTLPSAQLFAFSRSFNVPPPIAHSYVLRVSLSAPNRLTALSLNLNNTQVLSLSDFAGGVTRVDRVATLLASNTIALQLSGVAGTRITITVFTVVMPQPVSLAPSPLDLTAGAGGTLTATLSPTPTAAGTLTVTSSNAGIASVPASVPFASGQTGVAIPVSAPGSGSAIVTASANGGQVSATVNVNGPPSVNITAPAANSVFTAPADITLSANASDADGTVAKVDFFDGATQVGTATAAPYSVTLANVSPGTHSFTARATDNLGATTTSGAVTVTVIVNAPPSVAITAPANNTVFTAPANVTITATAADGEGTVAKVDFYAGATLIGTASAAPYSFLWANVASGSYSLTAVATDNLGASTTSAAVAVTVNAAPSVAITAPASGAVFNAPGTIAITASAADSDGTIAKVEFYQGGTLITTLTAAPYSFGWTGVPAGNYSLTAVATDNQGGSTPSAAVGIRVDAAPTVSLTSPANGASFTAPATITLTATAADADGTIAGVDFYQGTTLVGSAATAPYSFTLNNVAAGSYSFTAVAMDNDGTSATSAAVSVTVSSGIAQIYYIHPDHLNTPRLIADSAGTTVWRNDQAEPFGNTPPNDDPNNTGNHFDFPLRFPGQYFDKETGLAQNWFRDYDAGLGRYVEFDPVGLRGGLNGFTYVYDNPLRYVDPKGLQTRPSQPNISVCSYYSQVTTTAGCAYHSFAFGVCRGEEDIVNFLSALITTAQMNCIRTCLIESDKQARASSACRTNGGCGQCTRKSCIDAYHRKCFTQCNALGGDLFFGGNYGAYPNDGD